MDIICMAAYLTPQEINEDISRLAQEIVEKRNCNRHF